MIYSEKIEFFSELLRACHDLYFWRYDRDMNHLADNSPVSAGLEMLMGIDDMKEKIRVYAQSHKVPLIITNAVSFLWIAAPEYRDDALFRIYVLGPFFIDGMARKTVERQIRSLGVSEHLKISALQSIRALPVISLNRILEYCQMLHFVLTGEHIKVSSLNYEAKTDSMPTVSEFSEEHALHGTYEAEQEMLRMVREGDMNYVEQISKMTTTGRLGKLSTDEADRQYKNAVLIGVTLFSRAAIDGGVSPETAMSLMDGYFQQVEAANSIAELTDVSIAYQTDFVSRVHAAKQNTGFSKPIGACISYIDLHIEENLRLADLASLVGYSEYYLSRRFKAETGRGIKDYIAEKRIERACFLLTKTSLPLADISDKLRYNSQSYFTESFRKAKGYTPAKYREQYQII